MLKTRTKPLPELVEEQLRKLPAKPGCYIYRAADGEVLYVGKALSLRSRVRSYFQESTRHGLRIARLVSKVQNIEWIVVDSEVEALVLECNLIKEHRPPYNVRLRDDKSYPYITITKERFPRVMFTRSVRKDGARYFGPYTSAYGVRDTLQLLHKVFPLIPCGKSWSGREEQKPCLYYHLGQCMGPCAGLSDASEYAKVVDKVARFLAGKEEGIVAELRRDMQHASDELDYERAAKVRDQIAAIETLLQRQKVLGSGRLDQDVVAVVKDERGAAIQMMYIRNGKLIGQRHFMLDGAAESAPSEAVQEFVKQYYANAPDVPREVLLPVQIEERNIVEQWLRQRRGSAVTVEVPQRGEKLKLIEMAATNAEEALSHFTEEMERKEKWGEAAMVHLMDSLGLATPTVRIEGYDISNISGTSPVGSMVVFENGQPAKAEYRRFKVRYNPETPNDFAMMHEIITRRLKAYLAEDPKFSKLPNLIMIDGGKGQLSAALKARDALGVSVPMVGLAKRMELIYVPSATPDGAPSRLESPKGSQLSSAKDSSDAPQRAAADDSGCGSEQLSRTELLEALLEQEPALAIAADSPADEPTDYPALHGSGAEAVEALGAVGPRGIPMCSDGDPQHSEANTQKTPSGQPLTRDTRPPTPDSRAYTHTEIELPLNSPGLLLLRRLRDEAHRFALTYHRKVRDKRMHGSALEEIPGVGPRRKRILLRTFGSVEGIRRAAVDEIAAVPSMTKRLAEQVKDYLQQA